jgi:hypothetical protein
VLIVGAALVARVIAADLPRKNVLRLDLAPTDCPVGQIDIEWTRAGEDEPDGGATLRFPEKAPKLVVLPLDLRTGDYWFQVVLHRDCTGQVAQPAMSYRRHLRLDGGETTLRLYRHP